MAGIDINFPKSYIFSNLRLACLKKAAGILCTMLSSRRWYQKYCQIPWSFIKSNIVNRETVGKRTLTWCLLAFLLYVYFSKCKEISKKPLTFWMKKSCLSMKTKKIVGIGALCVLWRWVFIFPPDVFQL